VVHVDPKNWDAWLHGTVADALALVKPQKADVFDLADAHRTDELLRPGPVSGSLF
jgi:putative SOS response-associated peptidase YedK